MNNALNLFNADELATYLRIPKSTIYHLAETKEIPAFKVGKQWRFRKDAIDRWIAKEEKRKNSKKERGLA